MRLQITAFENCIKCTQYTKSTEDEKFLFWKNSDTSIEKQSNHDWNTPSYLKNNGPHIKVTLIFWFFIMIFYLCFYLQLWVKCVCAHIGNSSKHIGQTHPRFPKYLWMFDTECNVHQIDIFDNWFDYSQSYQRVINTSTWRKKTIYCIEHI